jgi:hypothetical protein
VEMAEVSRAALLPPGPTLAETWPRWSHHTSTLRSTLRYTYGPTSSCGAICCARLDQVSQLFLPCSEIALLQLE